MRNRILRLITLVALAAIIAVLPVMEAGCASSEPAEKTLKIGMLTPATGPVADKGMAGRDGLLDAVKYINEELGGVSGYKIEAVYRDSGYDATKVVNFVKEFMDQKCLMFTSHASTEMSYAQSIANDAGFPGLVTYASPINYRPPAHIYGQAPDYGDDFGTFATYYMENIWQGTGKPKVALLLLNNPTGKGAKDGAMAVADALGLELLPPEEHASTTISEMESLTRVKAANPDLIFISSTPAPTAVIMKNLHDLGMYPGVTVAMAHASFTQALVNQAGADLVEGVYGVFPTATWNDNITAVAKAIEYAQKYNPQDVGSADYLSTWTCVMIVKEILKNAVENAGYETLAKGDAAAWKALEEQGIQKLNGYNVEGLQGPVKYTPGDNRLDKLLKVYQITSGNINALTDWIEAPLIKYEEFSWFGAK
ncbi:MAG: ABC transporter substrate-binding protein [Dehalococcoidales bacterium]|nr:ABC transporter substrate-binding protein [Dehalococcoidales bacterium]